MFKNRIFITGVLIIAAAGLMGGGFYFGYSNGYSAGIEKPKTIIVKGVANLEKGKPEEIDFSVFWDAWETIKEKYVGAEKVGNQELIYGAVSGLLKSLGDDYSVFMPPVDAKRFNEDISGEFSGVGMEIGIRNGQLLVISPLKDTPAFKAGIKAGDKILKINGTSTIDVSVDAAVKMIRGPKKTKVVVTILRNGLEKPEDIEIIRDIIQIPTLDFEIKDGNIAYFKLYNFYENAQTLFYGAALQAAIANQSGIILDLRNNPGGYLEAAVNIAGLFVKRGDLVVAEEFRSGKKQEFFASGSGFLKDLPLVILINEGSASAAEILAGAIRDQRGAKLVGKKSFGKGSVQELQPLKDDSMIKITVAKWLLPKGQTIERNGLVPDYEVEITDKDAEDGKDPQFEKAMEILKKEIK